MGSIQGLASQFIAVDSSQRSTSSSRDNLLRNIISIIVSDYELGRRFLLPHYR